MLLPKITANRALVFLLLAPSTLAYIIASSHQPAPPRARVAALTPRDDSDSNAADSEWADGEGTGSDITVEDEEPSSNATGPSPYFWSCGKTPQTRPNTTLTPLERYVAADFVRYATDTILTAYNQAFPMYKSNGVGMRLVFNLSDSLVGQTGHVVVLTFVNTLPHEMSVPLTSRDRAGPTLGQLLAARILERLYDPLCALMRDDRYFATGHVDLSTRVFVDVYQGISYSQYTNAGSKRILQRVIPPVAQWTERMIRDRLLEMVRRSMDRARAGTA